jgi:hypothetical protein
MTLAYRGMGGMLSNDLQSKLPALAGVARPFPKSFFPAGEGCRTPCPMTPPREKVDLPRFM